MQNIASKIERLMELVLSLNADIADQEKYIRELEDKLSILNTIKEVNYYMGAELELNKVIQVISDVVMGVLGVSVCAIYLKNENTWDVKEHSILGQRASLLKMEDISLLEENLAGRKGEIVIPDLSTSNFLGMKEGSFIALSLMRGQVNYGIISIYYITPGSLNEGKEEFFRLVSTQLGIHLENAYLFEKIKMASITDGLTGLHNRLHLNELLQTYQPSDINHCAIIMMDIDNFKKVNDTYGHIFGDDVLKGLAGILKSMAKKYDATVFRYGGEEFIMLCSGLEMEKVCTLAEEIRSGFSDLGFKADHEEVHFTISLGVSKFGYSSKILDITRLIDIADEALYFSKKSGKNRYTVSTSDLQLYLESFDAITKMVARYKRYKNTLILFKGEFTFEHDFSKADFQEFMRQVNHSFRVYDSIIFNHTGGFICILEDSVDMNQIRTRLLETVQIFSPRNLSVSMMTYNNENTDLLSFFNLKKE